MFDFCTKAIKVMAHHRVWWVEYVSHIALIPDQANGLNIHNTFALIIDNKFGILCNRKRTLSVKTYPSIISEILISDGFNVTLNMMVKLTDIRNGI